MESQGEKPIEIKGMVLNLYERVLVHALNHKISVLLASFVILIFLFQVWMLKIGIEKPVEFFPSIDPGSVYVNIAVPEGADLKFIDRTVKEVEMAISGSDSQTYQEAISLQTHQNSDGSSFMAPSDINNVEHILPGWYKMRAALSLIPTCPTISGFNSLTLRIGPPHQTRFRRNPQKSRPHCRGQNHGG